LASGGRSSYSKSWQRQWTQIVISQLPLQVIYVKLSNEWSTAGWFGTWKKQDNHKNAEWLYKMQQYHRSAYTSQNLCLWSIYSETTCCCCLFWFGEGVWYNMEMWNYARSIEMQVLEDAYLSLFRASYWIDNSVWVLVTTNPISLIRRRVFHKAASCQLLCLLLRLTLLLKILPQAWNVLSTLTIFLLLLQLYAHNWKTSSANTQ